MRIYIKTIPRSSRNGVEKMQDGSYKVRVTAPPVDNRANTMVLSVLARFFDVPKSSLQIIGGKSARMKIIEIK